MPNRYQKNRVQNYCSKSFINFLIVFARQEILNNQCKGIRSRFEAIEIKVWNKYTDGSRKLLVLILMIHCRSYVCLVFLHYDRCCKLMVRLFQLVICFFLWIKKSTKSSRSTDNIKNFIKTEYTWENMLFISDPSEIPTWPSSIDWIIAKVNFDQCWKLIDVVPPGQNRFGYKELVESSVILTDLCWWRVGLLVGVETRRTLRIMAKIFLEEELTLLLLSLFPYFADLCPVSELRNVRNALFAI